MTTRPRFLPKWREMARPQFADCITLKVLRSGNIGRRGPPRGPVGVWLGMGVGVRRGYRLRGGGRGEGATHCPQTWTAARTAARVPCGRPARFAGPLGTRRTSSRAPGGRGPRVASPQSASAAVASPAAPRWKPSARCTCHATGPLPAGTNGMATFS